MAKPGRSGRRATGRAADGGFLRHCRSMALALDKIGKTYEPLLYAVGREKIREYAEAVGETNPLHHDLDAARAAGHADLVAPPMFVVVYASRAFLPALFDPELEIDFSMLVHGGQEFRWDGPLVVGGDEITTTLRVHDIRRRADLGFYVFASESVNQRGEVVSTGVWTNIVRGVEA